MLRLHYCGGYEIVPDRNRKCPAWDTHTWWPTGYQASSEYADLRYEQGWVQVQCHHCGLWAWWLPPCVVAPEQVNEQALRIAAYAKEAAAYVEQQMAESGDR